MNHNSSSNNLFKIENNLNFLLNKKNEIIKYNEIFNFFKIKNIKECYRINKMNSNSLIYLLSNKKNKYILRISKKKESISLEQQCLIAKNLKKRKFINPIRNKENKFILSKKKLSFLFYKKINGNIYDGNPKYFLKIFKNAIIFFNDLKHNKTNKHKNIDINKYNIKKIIKSCNDLLNESFINDLFKNKFITLKTKKLILLENMFLRQSLNLLENLKLKKNNIHLIHSDLNHSNIIIDNNKVKFIDLESIRFDYTKIAVGHLFFKIVRHAIFNKKISVINFKKKNLPKILNLLINNLKIYKSSAELYLFCIFKILSDIARILRFYKIKKNSRLMYDLEKKIHNLFEVSIILK